MDYLEIIKNEKPQEGLESFAASFCSDRIAELGECKTMLKNSNLLDLGKIVHQWKGFSAPYGFNFLGQSSLEIEKYIEDNSLESIEQKLFEIEKYLGLKKEHLQSM